MNTKVLTILVVASLSMVGCTDKNESAKPKQLAAPKETTPDATANPALQTTKKRVPFSEEDCAHFQSEILKDYRSGYITVPEDYANPEGKKIKVLWYTKMKPGQTAVMFFYGGPLYDDRMHYALFSQVEDRYNLGIIYMDQRGTGCSGRPTGTVVDFETAKSASMYSSDNIVRDAEEVRKVVLGENTKWKIYGQSWGGYIVDRYITMAPEKIDSAHVFAGGAEHSAAKFMTDRMLSNVRVANYFLNDQPGYREKLASFKSMFKADLCFQFVWVRLCGEELYHEIAEENLLSVVNWLPFLPILDQPIGEYSPFLNENELNAKYWNDFAMNNEWFLRFFFNYDQYLKVKAIKLQESKWEDSENGIGGVCDQALANLEKMGLLISDLPFNHCYRVQKISKDPAFSVRWNELIKVPIRKLLLPSDVFTTLKKNPNLKYFANTGKFDSIDVWSENYEKLATLPNVTYRYFETADHGGYIDEGQVWKDISGVDVGFLDSIVQFNVGSNTIRSEAQSAANGAQSSNLRLENEGVYIGYADTDLSEEIKAQVKGKVALIMRGKAILVEKAQRAIDAGAIAVIIGNNNKYVNKPFSIAMEPNVQTPVLMMETNAFKQLIEQDGALTNGVPIRIEIK